MSAGTRRAARLVTAAVAAFGLVVGSASVAQAAEPGTNWWYDAFGVPEAQAAGWTGAGVKIAVIDGQINTELPVFAGTHLTVDKDPLCEGGSVTTTAPNPSNEVAHGSNVTALLVGNGTGKGQVRGIAPDADVTFYGYGYDGDSGPGTACILDTLPDGLTVFGEGIERAVADGARVISISQGTSNTTEGDAAVIADALAKGVVIVAATPNSMNDDELKWLWSFNGVVAVNAFDKDGNLQPDQEVSGQKVAWPETTVVAPGVGLPSVDWGSTEHVVSGSSFATPLTAGVLALTMQKYPGATGNQVVQSLIHNTTPDDHALSRDDTVGYGPVSLRHLLRVNPSQYPDENPLLDKASGVPSAEQVAKAGAASSPSTSPSASAAAPLPDHADDSGSGVPTWVWLVAGAGVLVVLAVIAIVIIVVVSGRRKNRNVGGSL